MPAQTNAQLDGSCVDIGGTLWQRDGVYYLSWRSPRHPLGHTVSGDRVSQVMANAFGAEDGFEECRVRKNIERHKRNEDTP
jgi:hypothetical protein